LPLGEAPQWGLGPLSRAGALGATGEARLLPDLFESE